MRVALATAVLAVLLSACSFISLPCSEGRHESGLLLVCPERSADASEELKRAWSAAWWLAEFNPDDFGYPWADAVTGTLEVRVATRFGETLARDWIARGVKRDAPKPAPDLVPPAVPVRIVTVDRTFRALQEAQHGPTLAKDLPDHRLIYEAGPDARRNAAVITIERLSDDLLRALAERYGTSAIVIRVDPFRPDIRLQ